MPVAFDPNRFRSAAAHYLAGRPAYAPLLITRVAERVGLTGASRVLDLGCGPGQLAHAFAPYAAEVLGLDPEPAMLEVARQNSPPNITFQQGSSYDLGPKLGSFELVAMGRAFHWMDRVDTLTRLDEMISPAGAIVLFDDGHPEAPENAWRAVFQDIVHRYAAEVPPLHRRRDPDWRPHVSLLLDSPFCSLEEIRIIERRPLSRQILVERALSRSSSSRASIGDAADGMVKEIEAITVPAGGLQEIVASVAVIARRPD